MKNIFIIIFALLICLSMSGCTGTASNGQESSDTTKATEATEVTEVTEVTDTTAAQPDNVHTEYDGFYITLNSVSEKSVSVTWHNDTGDENITFGEYYHVEINKNGVWERVPATGEIIVHDIAYALPANGGQKKMSFSLSHLDMSEPGTYRVRCEFYDNGNKFSTWVEFEVPIK